ncbi:MAG: hypothetical protein DRQ55_15290 [Planctomycetota bacterium]|nr:MAG: hypothetical protein DRQ55_15290 [Planctomycetota bacterium]
MQTALTEKTLLRDVWARGFLDGLPDIAMGLLLVNIQLGGWLAELGLSTGWTIGVPIVVMLTVLLAVPWCRRHLTTPRLGEFRIHKTRRRKLLPVMLVSVAITLALVGFTAASKAAAFEGDVPLVLIILGVFAVKAVVLCSLAGWYFGVDRLYAYGWLIAWSFLGSETLIRTTELPLLACYLLGFGVSSAVMVACGLVRLRRFLHDFPLPHDETPT